MKSNLVILALAVIGLLLAGCTGATGEIKASLGQEVSLSIGQTVVIKGEDLTITFLEVLEDSRCPKDATCVWAGRVRCLVQVKYDDSSENIELTEPGLGNQQSGVTYQNYRITFRVMPYPELGKSIEESDYRLIMTVNNFGILHGKVTIGPLSPVQRPGLTPAVPCDVYEVRKIMLYDKDGSNLIEQVDIDCDGRYRAELEPDIYTVDINRIGIDSSSDVPKQVEITAGVTTRLDIDIDTGLR